MSRKDEIRNAYKYLGKEATFIRRFMNIYIAG